MSFFLSFFLAFLLSCSLACLLACFLSFFLSFLPSFFLSFFDRVQEDKAWTQSPATELTEFREDRVQEDKAWTQSPATEPRVHRGGQGHRVDRVQGRGQEEDKAQEPRQS